jgi:hypothetical protein
VCFCVNHFSIVSHGLSAFLGLDGLARDLSLRDLPLLGLFEHNRIQHFSTLFATLPLLVRGKKKRDEPQRPRGAQRDPLCPSYSSSRDRKNVLRNEIIGNPAVFLGFWEAELE